MKNIKFILLSVIAVLCGSNVNAQSLKICKTDGTFIMVPYSELDRIVAVNNDEEVTEHEFVDLGLSVKWATCNIGAENAEDHGDYFAWGELATKDSYENSNSVTYNKDVEDFAGNPEFDVAAALWGGSARMPTEAELQELVDSCTWDIIAEEGTNGMLVTGPNGNSIFLPAAGANFGTSVEYGDMFGFYWGSTPYGDLNDRGCCLNFYNFGGQSIFWGYRKDGYSVRPVME